MSNCAVGCGSFAKPKVPQQLQVPKVTPQGVIDLGAPQKQSSDSVKAVVNSVAKMFRLR